jgi:hypothetical protein
MWVKIIIRSLSYLKDQQVSGFIAAEEDGNLTGKTNYNERTGKHEL